MWNAECPNITAELAMFPYMFPFGGGAYGSTPWTIVKYLAQRARCLFSPWTLCKPYTMLMGCVRQASRLAEPATQVWMACAKDA
jgi:hypothetical protein